MPKQWVVKKLETEILPNLPELPPLIVRLLGLRGITEPAKIQEFLNPDYSRLHDPFLFQDMQKAVTRIEQAIERREKITIYADYDADAITACSVLYLALKKLGAQVGSYIPDRFTEGYGMNGEAIKSIAGQGTKLIITVDCGINAVAEAISCTELGIDLIITDHHELVGELPTAFAVINPKNPRDEYPFPYLTGVGVAYKLVQALFQKANTGWEKWLLDLVAIGTVADLQSLSGENRLLVSFGLKVLAKTRWPGLRALLQLAGAENRIDTYTLAFILAPRINAAGRIKHGNVAFELLISENEQAAQLLAKELNELNLKRQALTDQVLSEARAQIQIATDKKVLLAYGSDWPKGVVGLVAGKLMEEYNRPVLTISVDAEGMAVGSARSLPNFDIVAALTAAKDLLQKYGGHTQAAGFTLMRENLENFYLKLLEYAEEANLVLNEPELAVDAEVAPADITWEVLEQLEQFSPYGMHNPKPRLLGRGFEVVDFRFVGSGNKHLKLKVRYGEHLLEAIAFGQAFLANNLTMGKKLDAVFELTANEWNGNKTMQLKILDAKINESR